jgi:hypothetical protein
MYNSEPSPWIVEAMSFNRKDVETYPALPKPIIVDSALEVRDAKEDWRECVLI